MMMDQFTTKAAEALSNAQLKAQGLHHNQLHALHLLGALLDDNAGVPRSLLKRIGIDIDRVTDMVESELTRLPGGSTRDALPTARDLGEVLAKAKDEAPAAKETAKPEAKDEKPAEPALAKEEKPAE